LLASGALTPIEAALVDWAARTLDVRVRTRFSRSGTEETYRRATAIEALVSTACGRGWLWKIRQLLLLG
jgi:hypothetical protein